MLEWGSKLTWLQWWGRNLLGFSVSIEMTWFLCGWSKLTWIHCGGSKLTWFLCVGWKWLVFSMGIKWLNLWGGGRIWLGFCIPAENHLVLVLASNFTWFLCGLTQIDCGGSNLTWFRCRDRNWLGFVWGSKMNCSSVLIEIGSVYVRYRTWLDFNVGIEIDVVLVWGSK